MAQAELVRALIAASGCAARLARADSRSWASATFDGARHRLEFAGPAEALDALTAGVEEREFALTWHFVADVAVVAREAEAVVVEALTVAAA